MWSGDTSLADDATSSFRHVMAPLSLFAKHSPGGGGDTYEMHQSRKRFFPILLCHVAIHFPHISSTHLGPKKKCHRLSEVSAPILCGDTSAADGATSSYCLIMSPAPFLSFKSFLKFYSLCNPKHSQTLELPSVPYSCVEALNLQTSRLWGKLEV